jgi:signal transduction histidine kinase
VSLLGQVWHRLAGVRVRDAVLVVVCAGLAWQGSAVVETSPGPRWAVLASMAPGILVLPWRRWRPLAALVVGLAPNVAYWLAVGAPESVGILLPVSVLGYAVGRWEPVRRRSYAALGLIVAMTVVHEWRDPTITSLPELMQALPYDGIALAAWLLGAYVRLRDEQRGAAEARIAATERTRIARELHDIVAHGIGVMVVQAEGAAEVVQRDPARARTALDHIADTGRESLVELRRALGVLREDSRGEGALAAPQPGLARLDDLIETVRRSGLQVEHDSTGTCTGLSAGADLTVYRVVQEALTNTLRHSGARRAYVRVSHGVGGVIVEVTDDGATAGPGPLGSGGSGLRGIRERVAMLGGDVEIGPMAGGGFRVSVRLPAQVAHG